MLDETRAGSDAPGKRLREGGVACLRRGWPLRHYCNEEKIRIRELTFGKKETTTKSRDYAIWYSDWRRYEKKLKKGNQRKGEGTPFSPRSFIKKKGGGGPPRILRKKGGDAVCPPCVKRKKGGDGKKKGSRQGSRVEQGRRLSGPGGKKRGRDLHHSKGEGCWVKGGARKERDFGNFLPEKRGLYYHRSGGKQNQVKQIREKERVEERVGSLRKGPDG